MNAQELGVHRDWIAVGARNSRAVMGHVSVGNPVTAIENTFETRSRSVRVGRLGINRRRPRSVRRFFSFRFPRKHVVDNTPGGPLENVPWRLLTVARRLSITPIGPYHST